MQYSLETVIYFEKSRSVALQYFFLQCSIDKSDTFLKHGGAFLQKNATLLWHRTPQ